MAFVGIIWLLFLAVLTAVFIVILICQSISCTGMLIVVLSSFRHAKKGRARFIGIPGIMIGSVLMILPFLFLNKSCCVATETAIVAMNYESTTDTLELCVEDGSLDDIYACFNDQVGVDDYDIESFSDSISDLDMSHCYVTQRQLVTYQADDSDSDNVEAYIYTIARVSHDDDNTDLMTMEICVVNHSDYRGLWYINVYESDGSLYDSIGEELPLNSISTCDIRRDEVD